MAYLLLNSILIISFSFLNDINNSKNGANVLKVEVSEKNRDFHFAVTLLSPDTGCDQYADWWEILSEDGKLLYRRILGHSHVNEQPFSRSGGPVDIKTNQTIWIRAHMNTVGYSGNVMTGSIEKGFAVANFPDNLGLGVEKQTPLPTGCAF